jgi:hypothetical protein
MNMLSILFAAALFAIIPSNAAPVPKALVVMLDGVRADAVENACAPNLQRFVSGNWQPGYNCAWSFTAKTVPDAVASSAPNHAAIALGVTTAKNCVTNTSKQFVLCDYRKWPSFLARIAEARPKSKTLFMYSWKADEKLCPHPKVEFSYGGSRSSKADDARWGGAYARDLANGAELVRRLASDAAPDATLLMLDCPDYGGHGLLGGWGGGFYPYSTSYLNAVHLCDGIVGRCLDAIANRPTFKDEDWIVIVTSDHGGYANTHGLVGGHATAVPLFVSSRHVRNGRIPGTPRNYDVAPTVLAHFGLDVSKMNLDGKVIGGETVSERERPLADGLATYMPFNSGAKGGYFGGCLKLPMDKKGGGVCLKDSEKLKFENGADFAITLWVRMDEKQKGDPVLVCNKDWKSRNNPGIAFCAAKRTEQVKERGVVFIGGKTGAKSSTDVGTYDVEYGKWTFYAATRGNDGVLRLYQGTSDGRLYCISDDMSDIVLDSGLPFYLGQDGTGRYGHSYNGFIDDFALWTRTLSHDEVKRIYESGRKGLAIADML